ncbi:MAG: sigma-54 dependent transcriptional regulator [Candidatus Omnitrophota bacterium]|nr:sigma-54 dependent transcriptional regulator [Candidatus Omnitrophota bacterium]
MSELGDFSSIITTDPKVTAVIRIAEKIAASDVNILLTGESGTGKNILSKAIHGASKRFAGPFVPVNCLAIPDSLVESELFGHEKGAFTDAKISKMGYFQSADRGTIFLDEIGDMTHAAQGKMLQIIEDRQFKKVGGEKLISCDVRIIAATNKNLAESIEKGEFREDLYYRLREVSLHLPALRDRREDVLLLIRHYVKHFCEVYEKPGLTISDTALNYLAQHDWPGNIRELRNVVKSAVVLCNENTLWLEHFPFEIRLQKKESAHGETTRPENPMEDFSVDTLMRKHVTETLSHFTWNKKKTAGALGISRPRLDRYIKKFDLEKRAA